MSVRFHEGRQKTNEVNDYKVHYNDPDSHTCVSHKTFQTSGNWISYLINDTYLHKRKTISYFMCYTKKATTRRFQLLQKKPRDYRRKQSL